jgi:hypothetical protein
MAELPHVFESLAHDLLEHGRGFLEENPTG